MLLLLLSLLALGSWRRVREFAIGAALAIFQAPARPIALGSWRRVREFASGAALAIFPALGRPIKLATTQALGRPIALGTALTAGAPVTGARGPAPARRREVAMALVSTGHGHNCSS